MCPDDHLLATAHAMCYYGVCGEVAVEGWGVRGPGSFRAAFLDALDGVEAEDVVKKGRISVVEPSSRDGEEGP